MNFKEFLQEANTLNLKKVKGIPSELLKLATKAKKLSLKHTHEFYELNGNFERPIYMKVYFADKSGNNLKNTDNIKFDDIDYNTRFFNYAYYAKSKASEKRGEYIIMDNNESIKTELKNLVR